MDNPLKIEIGDFVKFDPPRKNGMLGSWSNTEEFNFGNYYEVTDINDIGHVYCFSLSNIFISKNKNNMYIDSTWVNHVKTKKKIQFEEQLERIVNERK